MAKRFWVADLDTKGEVRLKEEYEYDSLQTINAAAVLIAEFATYLWRDPQGFDVRLPGVPTMTMRWAPTADTAGIATLRCRGRVASASVLATGKSGQNDAITFGAFQSQLLRELHDTGYEPAFDLLSLSERPIVASIHFESPQEPGEREAFALADRAFAAAYFRYQGLA